MEISHTYPFFTTLSVLFVVVAIVLAYRGATARGPRLRSFGGAGLMVAFAVVFLALVPFRRVTKIDRDAGRITVETTALFGGGKNEIAIASVTGVRIVVGTYFATLAIVAGDKSVDVDTAFKLFTGSKDGPTSMTEEAQRIATELGTTVLK